MCVLSHFCRIQFFVTLWMIASTHGILQARILEWVAVLCSRGSSQPRDGTHVSCIVRWVFFFFTTGPLGKHCEFTAAAAKSLQSCLTLCDPIDGSPPGSPVPGILQARTLERVAISFSSEFTTICLFILLLNICIVSSFELL